MKSALSKRVKVECLVHRLDLLRVCIHTSVLENRYTGVSHCVASNNDAMGTQLASF
jgi:hypothetical protein